MKVAEALVLRKHLEAKVRQLEPLKQQGDRGLFEIKTERKPVSETVDQVTTVIPNINLETITEEYDKYSKALRQLDTKIQETNWITEIEFDDSKLNV